jgi:hypothetical protein
MANISIDDLSLTISELIDLQPNQQNLIESAVNRAISVKDITGGFVYYKDQFAPPPPVLPVLPVVLTVFDKPVSPVPVDSRLFRYFA